MNPFANFKSSSRSRGNPGEPLYTVDELADRMRIRSTSLRSLMAAHGGLDAWTTISATQSAMARKMYRTSDAKRWWKSLPQAVRDHVRNVAVAAPA